MASDLKRLCEAVVIEGDLMALYGLLDCLRENRDERYMSVQRAVGEAVRSAKPYGDLGDVPTDDTAWHNIQVSSVGRVKSVVRALFWELFDDARERVAILQARAKEGRREVEDGDWPNDEGDLVPAEAEMEGHVMVSDGRPTLWFYPEGNEDAQREVERAAQNEPGRHVILPHSALRGLDGTGLSTESVGESGGGRVCRMNLGGGLSVTPVPLDGSPRFGPGIGGHMLGVAWGTPPSDDTPPPSE